MSRNAKEALCVRPQHILQQEMLISIASHDTTKLQKLFKMVNINWASEGVGCHHSTHKKCKTDWISHALLWQSRY